MRQVSARTLLHSAIDDVSADPVLEHRYALFCGAHAAVQTHAGANALLRFYEQASGCRRAAETIQLAESLAESGFQRLAPEQIGSERGDCSDCARSCCIAAELDAAAERLVG